MIEEADRDNSGAIDFREFCSLMVKREREKETDEDIKQAFRVFDKVSNIEIHVMLNMYCLGFRMVMAMCLHQN